MIGVAGSVLLTVGFGLVVAAFHFTTIMTLARKKH
jgi:hypothetical protein